MVAGANLHVIAEKSAVFRHGFEDRLLHPRGEDVRKFPDFSIADVPGMPVGARIEPVWVGRFPECPSRCQACNLLRHLTGRKLAADPVRNFLGHLNPQAGRHPVDRLASLEETALVAEHERAQCARDIQNALRTR